MRKELIDDPSLNFIGRRDRNAGGQKQNNTPLKDIRSPSVFYNAKERR